MQDFVPRGTGNSRFLKSISTFLTAYPTYADFAAALIAGTLPVDFNGVNSAGYAQLGTPLNKANLLTDAVANAIAALTGETAPGTPNEALNGLVTALNIMESNKVLMEIGTYTGTGVYGSTNTPNSLTFDFVPKAMFVHRAVRGGISSTPHTAFMTLWGEQPGYTVWGYGQSTYATGTVTLSGTTVTWYHDSGTNHQMNTNGWLYDYVAFG